VLSSTCLAVKKRPTSSITKAVPRRRSKMVLPFSR
jgi:hypothetical protein